MARLEIQGGAEVSQWLRKYGERFAKEAEKAVKATAIEVRGDIVKRIQQGPATGVVYQKSSPSRTHQASAPGEAPATDTGRLASSIVFEMTGRLSATVGSDLVYAAALEFGTATIDPRPAWLPAVEAARPKFMKRLEAAHDRARK